LNVIGNCDAYVDRGVLGCRQGEGGQVGEGGRLGEEVGEGDMD